jgi:hypothetical protein
MTTSTGAVYKTTNSGRNWKVRHPPVVYAYGGGADACSLTDFAWYGFGWTHTATPQAQVKETIDATLNRISSSGVQGASFFSGEEKGMYQHPLPNPSRLAHPLAPPLHQPRHTLPHTAACMLHPHLTCFTPPLPVLAQATSST